MRFNIELQKQQPDIGFYGFWNTRGATISFLWIVVVVSKPLEYKRFNFSGEAALTRIAVTRCELNNFSVKSMLVTARATF